MKLGKQVNYPTPELVNRNPDPTSTLSPNSINFSSDPTKTDSSKTPGLQPLQKERKDLKSDLIRELKGKTPMLSVKQLIDSPIAPPNSYTLTHQVG